ncbi:MAG TPA: hypothetical protein VK911_15045, partial [Vicinamibacterales bacterium]|nr:hypothetical protein [Vicinamibacterales bacterium]
MSRVTRRNFFRTSSAAAAALPLGALNAAAGGQREDAAPRVRRHKPFGRTGWSVGDISAGSGQNDPALVDHLFARGINLIDTGA